MLLICYCFDVYFNILHIWHKVNGTCGGVKKIICTEKFMSFTTPINFFETCSLFIYLYIYSLFGVAVASIGCVASNGEMINEQWIGKDCGSGHGLIWAISLERHAGVRILPICVLHNERIHEPGCVSYTLFCQSSSHSQCPSFLASLFPAYI
jgi:hypothetical protein